MRLPVLNSVPNAEVQGSVPPNVPADFVDLARVRPQYLDPKLSGFFNEQAVLHAWHRAFENVLALVPRMNVSPESGEAIVRRTLKAIDEVMPGAHRLSINDMRGDFHHLLGPTTDGSKEERFGIPDLLLAERSSLARAFFRISHVIAQHRNDMHLAIREHIVPRCLAILSATGLMIGDLSHLERSLTEHPEFPSFGKSLSLAEESGRELGRLLKSDTNISDEERAQFTALRDRLVGNICFAIARPDISEEAARTAVRALGAFGTSAAPALQYLIDSSDLSTTLRQTLLVERMAVDLIEEL